MKNIDQESALRSFLEQKYLRHISAEEKKIFLSSQGISKSLLDNFLMHPMLEKYLFMYFRETFQKMIQNLDIQSSWRRLSQL